MKALLMNLEFIKALVDGNSIEAEA
jgi:hypothetical protein